MVSVTLRRLLVGAAAITASIGWLQLAPAFGAPVTAPAAMLDRMLGADREAGLAGWALLMLGEAAFVASYFALVERRARGPVSSAAYALLAWLIVGAVVMPLVGLLQGAPPPGAAANDPMRASFFMLNLGIGAAAESLIAWLLFTAVLAAGRTLTVSSRAFALLVGAAAIAAAAAFAAPGLAGRASSTHVAEGRVAALPPTPVFISVLELPQPPGAVLGPHQHVAGFVAGLSGVATMLIAGNVVDVGPGDAFFTADGLLHDHENRATVPFAIALATVIGGITIALQLPRAARVSRVLMGALLVTGVVATIDPLMNHWYFIAVRPAAARGAVMPVPAGHRAYESDNLTGLSAGPQVERLVDQRLSAGESVPVTGPAAIVVLDGDLSLTSDQRRAALSAQGGATIPGGTTATIQSRSTSARLLIVQLLPAP